MRALVAVAHQHDPYGRGLLIGEPGGLDQDLQPLLEAHVAGVQQHGVLLGPAQARPGLVPVTARALHMRPVGHHMHPCARHAHRRDPVHERLVHHPDDGRRAQDPGLHRPGQGGRPATALDAALFGGRSHQVLDDHDMRHPGLSREAPAQHSPGQAGHLGEHHVGADARGRHGAVGQDARLEQRPPQGGLTWRNGVAPAVHRDAAAALAYPPAAAIALRDPPGGVVRHTREDMGVGAGCGQVLGDLRRVRPYTGVFGCVVGRDHEHTPARERVFHDWSPSGCAVIVGVRRGPRAVIWVAIVSRRRPCFPMSLTLCSLVGTWGEVGGCCAGIGPVP